MVYNAMLSCLYPKLYGRSSGCTISELARALLAVDRSKYKWLHAMTDAQISFLEELIDHGDDRTVNIGNIDTCWGNQLLTDIWAIR